MSRHVHVIKRNKVRGLKFLLVILIAVPLIGFALMALWNWLMPPIFGLGRVSFWQALGLLALSRILVGGFRGRPHRAHGGGDWRLRMLDRWEQMTPEQREKFREALRRGESFTIEPPPEPKS